MLHSAAYSSVVFSLTVILSATAVAGWRPWANTSATFADVGFTARPTSSGSLLYGTSKKYEGSSEFVDLKYHMGPVLTGPEITVHRIWYGRWLPPQKRIIREFISSISAESAPAPSVSGWWRTVRLYTDQTGANISRTVRLGSEKSDRFYSHGKSLTRLSIQTVIKSAVSASTKPLPISPKSALYLLLTSDDVYVQDFCHQQIGLFNIWYGRWLPPQKRIIREFISSISAESAPAPSVSGWWRTVRLYTDQTGANISRTVRLGSEKSDRFYSHGKSLTRLSIQTVIKSAVSASTKPLPISPKSALYLLLTSDDVYVQDFCHQVCGFHYFTFPSIVGYTLPYAWVGNSAKFCPGMCAYPFAVPEYIPGLKPLKSPNGDASVDGMISVIAHEIAEAVTNPLVNAWYAGSDPTDPVEIGDLCEGIYGSGGGGSYTGQMSSGRDGATYNMNGIRRRFLVQWVWNHLLNYCTGPNALDHP